MNQRPNILIVCIDSMRADHLPCYGYHRPTAPTIDRLAAEGCVFDNVFSAAPFSPASYASIFSNLYPHQHGVNGDDVRIWPDTWPRLPEKLRELGYRTFCISNNSFVSAELNGARGFDTFVGPRNPWLLRQHGRLYKLVRSVLGESAARLVDFNSLLAREKGDSARAIFDAATLIYDNSKPFFGFIILMDPHALYHPRRTRFSVHRTALRRFLWDINGRQMFARLMADNRPVDPEMRQAAVDLYDAEIFHADAQLGRLTDLLRRDGQLDNTLLAVCADHGEAFGEHGVWGHGFSLHDYMTRVPLILRYPKAFASGSRCDALVQLHHLHDTCLALANGAHTSSENQAPACANNRKDAQDTAQELGDVDTAEVDDLASLLPHAQSPVPHSFTRATDPAWTGCEAVFSEFPLQTGTLRMLRNFNPDFQREEWSVGMWSLRTRDWRYVEYDNGKHELFDLVDDPDATRDVSHAHPQRCVDFAARLAAHREDRTHEPTAPGTSPQVNEAILDRLRALGYID